VIYIAMLYQKFAELGLNPFTRRRFDESEVRPLGA
jgi:hypothetical protein